MQLVWLILFTLLGLAIASFLNVCIDRLPAARPGGLLRPPSHCDACQRRVAIKDLIPIFSYLRLRGRCRYCQSPIPRRVLWVEIGTGALFACLYWRYGLSPQLGITAFYSCVFIVLFVIDLERGLILNKIVYPVSVIALGLSLLPAGPGIVNALIGGAIGFTILLIIVIVTRGGMGEGDIKMAGLIGLVTGFPKIFVALLAAVVVGALVAVILMVFKIKKGKQSIPFGPFLAIGAMVTLLYGDAILNGYRLIMNWYAGLLASLPLVYLALLAVIFLAALAGVILLLLRIRRRQV